MSIMLFADDVILLSFTITGLQHQLNILNDTVNNLGLVVNLSKSNVVVFRNGGHLALGRIRITGCHTCALRCTDTGLGLLGKTKVYV